MFLSPFCYQKGTKICGNFWQIASPGGDGGTEPVFSLFYAIFKRLLNFLAVGFSASLDGLRHRKAGMDVLFSGEKYQKSFFPSCFGESRTTRGWDFDSFSFLSRLVPWGKFEWMYFSLKKSTKRTFSFALDAGELRADGIWRVDEGFLARIRLHRREGDATKRVS